MLLDPKPDTNGFIEYRYAYRLSNEDVSESFYTTLGSRESNSDDQVGTMKK